MAYFAFLATTGAACLPTLQAIGEGEMRVILACIAVVVVVAAGVYSGVYLWDQQRSRDRAKLIEYCMLRADYWARARMPDHMERECIAIGIYP